MQRLVLVRYGEIGLRGKNRPWFEGRLRDRIQRTLRDLGGMRVSRSHGRLFIRGDLPETGEVMARLQRVFGVVSASPALELAADLEALQAGARLLVEERIAALGRTPSAEAPLRFKAEARRANKRFPMNSHEINCALGDHLLTAIPHLKVDLHHPEVVVSAELREEAAYMFAETMAGPGGLPYGSSGRAVCLLSGGIDSPVAAWMAMKRGVQVEAVHFHTPPFTSPRARDKVVDLCRVLAGWGDRVTLHLVHFTEVQKALHQHAPEDLIITLMRRFMLRIAAGLAARTEALALVTGESIGQVASQTLESMDTISEVADLPILRPVIAHDKAEIIRTAKAIGTYEISIRPYEDCCALFVPKNPKTRPRRAQAAAAEARLDVAALVDAALQRTETLVVEAAATSDPV